MKMWHHYSKLFIYLFLYYAFFSLFAGLLWNIHYLIYFILHFSPKCFLNKAPFFFFCILGQD